MALCVHQDAVGGLRQVQLVIDADERLHGGRSWRGITKLELFVVQGLGEGVTLGGQRAQRADVYGQRALVVLHELGKIQNGGDDLGREGGA